MRFLARQPFFRSADIELLAEKARHRGAFGSLLPQLPYTPAFPPTARFVASTVCTTVLGPVTTSPAANTPSTLVCPCSSTHRRPRSSQVRRFGGGHELAQRLLRGGDDHRVARHLVELLLIADHLVVGVEQCRPEDGAGLVDGAHGPYRTRCRLHRAERTPTSSELAETCFDRA